MNQTDLNYSLLRNWWEKIDLTNYEKSYLNKEIVSFNQQLIRVEEKKLRIGVFGKAGVGKSTVLNILLNKKECKTGIINGSTKEVECKDWIVNHKTFKAIELLDSPGFDFCDIKNSENIFSKINDTEVILFVVTGDLNRNEVSKINLFIKNGKKIILVLNKIHVWNKKELKNILKNIRSKITQNIDIPIVLNEGEEIKKQILETINKYGENLLILNSLQLADRLMTKVKKSRLKKRQKEAQSIIGKFATIKASGVAINPLFIIDIAGSFALDTALISELSKVYGLTIKGDSARKIIKQISLDNICLGATQIGINASFNLLRKVILISAPFTNGLSLLPYGPIAIIQAFIAVRSTKIVGKLAAKEIFQRSKVCRIDPLQLIQKITMKEPEIFNHTKIYLSKKNLDNSFAIFLP